MLSFLLGCVIGGNGYALWAYWRHDDEIWEIVSLFTHVVSIVIAVFLTIVLAGG